MISLPSLTAASALRGRLVLAVAQAYAERFLLPHPHFRRASDALMERARRTPCPAYSDINSRRSYLWAAARTSLVRVFRTGKGGSSSSRSLASIGNRFSGTCACSRTYAHGSIRPPQFILVGHVRSPPLRLSSLHVPGTATSLLPASTRCLRPRRTRTADE